MAEEQRSVSDYHRFEDERPFLAKATEHALGDDDRVRYAKLVEKRDPERAEWLRLEMALHARGVEDPAMLARFLELARVVGYEFANLLLRHRILNCGSAEARKEPPRVRFAFRCPKRWETLAPAEADGVRFCQLCSEHVYRCSTVDEAASRALAGQCVAIPKELSDGGVDEAALGRPDPAALWANRLFGRY